VTATQFPLPRTFHQLPDLLAIEMLLSFLMTNAHIYRALNLALFPVLAGYLKMHAIETIGAKPEASA
jgi:hypothetical protein